MSDTCIVCLGDLGEGGKADPNIDHIVVPRASDNLGDTSTTTAANITTAIPETGDIAHLQPCGHYLHNECLKPWVERANSCPICRRNFNVVELVSKVGGDTISSYIVEDRIQVADIDPSLIADDLIDGPAFQPCPICNDDDNEDVLLICDGCDVPSHTYCVGLDAVPVGDWYCAHCEAQRTGTSQPPTSSQTRPNLRTRTELRRARNHNQMNTLHWARVWQSVYDRLNLDLDFPFDDEHATDRRSLLTQRRELVNRRGFRPRARRFRTSEQQGNRRRFREAMPESLEMRRGWPSRPRQRIESPEPETLDEIRAWNAFERARNIADAMESNNSRKRKSPSSPVEPEADQPERKLKRPRTKRAEALADVADQDGDPSSSRGRSMNRHSNIPAHNTPTSSGPSFLQALLKEVEESSTPSRVNGPRNAPFTYSNPESSSSGPSSPALSPLSSSRSSSRPSSISPPPPQRRRPTLGNDSRNVESVSSLEPCPTEPLTSTNFSSAASSPASGLRTGDTTPSRSRPSRVGHGHTTEASFSPLRTHATGSSPIHSGLSLSSKSDLQQMVKAVLKPFYYRKEVSKDEYTDINRRISHLLYDQAVASKSLDAETKSKLAVIANTEVTKAVSILKGLRTDAQTIAAEARG